MPITANVERIVLIALLGLGFALAHAVAKGLLALILHAMMHPPRGVAIAWRPVIFLVSLFWFWYLTPGVVESRALARMVQFLAP